MFADFINTYGTELLYLAITAIAGWIGSMVKKYLDEKIKDQRVKSVIKTVVQGVEQIYKDLHGEEKLNAALSAASEMLAEKGITVSDLELKMLIEAAVGEFNDVFNNKPDAVEPTEGETNESAE